MSSEYSEYHEGLSKAINTLLRWSIHEAETYPHRSPKAQTVTQLADALGQHRPNISAKLNGSRVWSLNDFFDVAHHYELTIDALVELMGTDPDHPPQKKQRLTGLPGK